MSKILILTVCLFLTIIGFTSACWAAVDYSGIIESESDWIAGLQQPTGSIVMTRDHTDTWDGSQHYRIQPYFANLALTGMLENPTAENINVARNWMIWYFSHLNNPDYNGINGTVYDYYADTSGNIEHSAGSYDSTDSYGSTFMVLAKKYYEVSGDGTFLVNNRVNIEKIADSVVATQQTDGLTYAKPDYQIKYLMDNCEVYEGLASMEWLERNVFNDTAKGNYYQEKKNQNSAGIETNLWNNSAGCYDPYYNQDPNLTTFYPDATCQVFPVWCDVIDHYSSRAQELTFKLNTNHAGWPYLDTPDSFPWAMLAYSAALTGDKYRADAFINSLKAANIDPGHTWTLYNMESGFLIRAAKTIRDLYNLALNKAITVSGNSPSAANINDGKQYTAWTGAAADNEWVKIDLGTGRQFNRLVLKWGTDFADQYKLQVSDDGTSFTDVYTELSGNGGTDDITLGSVQLKRYVRLLFTHRSSLNGVTLKEVEFYHEPVNLAQNKTVTASSNNSDAFKSVDGYASTRWGSSYSNNQWYKIDLGSAYDINKVVIDWEAAYDTAYSIQVSNDDSSYTAIYSTASGNGGIDEIKFSTTNARYIKVLCTTRATTYGSSFWEVRVYNDSNTVAIPAEVFYDGFESNNFSAGGWTSNGCTTGSTYKYSGTYCAVFNNSDLLVKAQNTIGYNNIQVQYARYTRNCETDDHFIAEWFDGSSWITMEDITGNSSWTLKTWSLPVSASNNSSFQVRFRTSHNSSADYAYLDEVRIIGIPN